MLDLADPRGLQSNTCINRAQLPPVHLKLCYASHVLFSLGHHQKLGDPVQGTARIGQNQAFLCGGNQILHCDQHATASTLLPMFFAM